ncbi:hypothetical protein ES703_60741 [subsurface metagenome]
MLAVHPTAVVERLVPAERAVGQRRAAFDVVVHPPTVKLGKVSAERAID